jgi:tetratricopeptide (TPR) repeat protein
MATISDALTLAIEHHRAGRLPAAEQIYWQILAVEPNHANALHLLGLIAYQVGKHGIAVEYIGRAILSQGNVAEFHNSLGEAYHALHQLSEAVACFRRALELRPDFAGAHSKLGNVFKDQGKLDETVACYRRAVALRPNLDYAHNNLGNALREQGKVDEAIACYRRALELQPNYADAHNNLGSAWQEKGDFQAAEDAIRAALRHNPRFGLAHFNLAQLLDGRLPETDLAAQRRLLEDRELADEQRFNLHFGVAQVLDARGEYAEAAEHLDRANALQLAEWRKCGQEYDPMEHESFITQMIATCTPAFFERVRGFGLNSKLPVFVVGLPRSGSTLIEQILASHSLIHGAGELGLGKLSVEAIPSVLGRSGPVFDCLRHLDGAGLLFLAAQQNKHLQTFAGAKAERVVDKMNDNYLYLGLLAALFPHAVFIHCRRELRDVAVSCWLRNFQDVRWANDYRHLASRLHQYQRLMEHWRKVLPVPLWEVDYEETVADLEGVARKLVPGVP